MKYLYTAIVYVGLMLLYLMTGCATANKVVLLSGNTGWWIEGGTEEGRQRKAESLCPKGYTAYYDKFFGENETKIGFVAKCKD